MANKEKRIEEELSVTIALVERLRTAARDAGSYKLECSEIWKQTDRIGVMLQTVSRIVNSNPFLYERPIGCVVAEVFRTLESALALVRKCKHRNILRRMASIVINADFRKLRSWLEACAEDMKWLLSVVDGEKGNENGGVGIAIAPIASNDSIFFRIWSDIASVQMGRLPCRIEAANRLASIAQDDDRNKRIIAEERGFPPLLMLLETGSSPEAQIAAATALFHLADVQDRVRMIAYEFGVPVIVHVFGNSPVRVQIVVAKLIARMAELDPITQEEFVREDVITPLMTLLSFEMVRNENGPKTSIDYVVQLAKEMNESSLPIRHLYSSSSLYSEGGSGGGLHNRMRENEEAEVKIELKTSFARALRMLAKGSMFNCKSIVQTNGLLCLAKLLEKEKGELQFNCLMSVMEITTIAESNTEFRKTVFKANSPFAKAIISQLLRLVEKADNSMLQIPAIKAIGSLSRTFSAKETRVISALVAQLSHWDHDVATEAAISLGKFACGENYLKVEHSESIIKFGGLTPLLKLMRVNKLSRLHGLVLLCYLAIHGGNSESFEQARLFTALDGAQHTMLDQHPELRELVLEAMFHVKNVLC